MNPGLRNEISTLFAIAGLGFWLSGKSRFATGSGLIAAGLRVIPTLGPSFRNQSIVITGGSRGLGLALAERLVQEGALVTILARDEEELQRAAVQLDALRGVPVFKLVCDVTNRHHLRSACQKIRDHFGDIDILINNAGSLAAGPFEAMTQADFEAEMNIHFYAPLKAIQTVLPGFQKKGRGHIVNISSVGGKVPVPHMSSYCASKFALTGFSQALSFELARQGIVVTTIHPGLMQTGSPVQGVFKGDHEKEFAWFALSDSMPGLSMSADRAARKIIETIRNQQRETVLSLPAKAGVFAASNFPETFHFTMSWINRLLPQGLSEERKTGAASKAWLESRNWARPFLGIMKRAQSRYNEKEKFDPQFNLNLNQT